MRSIYRWNGGVLEPAGAVSEAHLRAWEYELASDVVWPPRSDRDEPAPDTVRLWRTRRPDLCVVELWVGDADRRPEPRPRR